MPTNRGNERAARTKEWEPMPHETLEDRAAALLPACTILKPPGAGPFPAVLQLHGCGGCKNFQQTYAKHLQQAGIAAIVIDSFAFRRISTLSAYTTVCTGLRLRGAERAGDVFALFDWAKKQPWVDSGKITAAGWSHGSWTIMDALALKPNHQLMAATGIADLAAEPLEGLHATFLVYPYCGLGSLTATQGWRFSPRSVGIVGGQDAIVGARDPLRVMEGLRKKGVPIETHLFPDATHSFDEPEAKDFRVRYNPARTKETIERLIALASA